MWQKNPITQLLQIESQIIFVNPFNLENLLHLSQLHCSLQNPYLANAFIRLGSPVTLPVYLMPLGMVFM